MAGPVILVADDHPAFRLALRMAIGRVAPEAMVLEAATLAEAAGLARVHGDLALVLLDLRMPGAVGVSGVALIRAEQPSVPILVISAEDGPSVADQAIAFGASGFLSKGSDLATIETRIAAALSGQTADTGAGQPTTTANCLADSGGSSDMASRVGMLTPTQLRVLHGLMAGKLNKQIAHELSISEATVKAHMTQLMRKLGVHSRTQAVLAARSLDLQPPD
ncbi:MAG: response regulator transcription factor [Sphingomonadaceae bacterium]